MPLESADDLTPVDRDDAFDDAVEELETTTLDRGPLAERKVPIRVGDLLLTRNRTIVVDGFGRRTRSEELFVIDLDDDWYHASDIVDALD